ncbi:MAG: S1C family serine protease, partial [Christensenellales bacterium]
MNGNGFEYETYRQDSRPPRKTGKILGMLSIMLCLAFVFGVAGYAIADAKNYRQPSGLSGQPQSNESAGNATALPKGSFSFDNPALTSTATGYSSVSEIAYRNLDAVVLVTAMVPVSGYGYDFNFGFGRFPFGEDRQQYGESRGSGFFISADGYIVTNNHVVEGAETVSVTLNNGETLDAIVVGTDEKTDIAVLKVEGSGFTFSALGDSGALLIGEPCIAIGNPLGTLTGTVTTGVISALERTINVDGQEMDLLQHDAAINEGNSGGPLYNMKGEVIGINSAKTAALGVEGLGFAIPVNSVKKVIEDLINVGYVTGRPYIGISVQEISEAQAKYYNVAAGIGVVGVATGSPAEKAGLKYGDIITAANGKETLTLDALNDVKESLKVGDVMELKVW